MSDEATFLREHVDSFWGIDLSTLTIDDSFLSDPNRSAGDPPVAFVITTSQQSINNGLLQALAQTQQPIVKLYFVDDGNGTPLRQIELAELQQNGCEDPLTFNTSNTPNYSHAKIAKLNDNHFRYALEVQTGLSTIPSSGGFPDPPVLNVEHGNYMTYNFLFKKFTMVENKPPWNGKPGSWTVTQQNPKTPYFISSKLSPRFAPLSLDWGSSFLAQSSQSDTRAAISARLANVDTASPSLGLHQLIFDLKPIVVADLPSWAELPQFHGIVAGTSLEALMKVALVPLYNAVMDGYIQAPVAIHAQGTSNSPSQLVPTGCSWLANGPASANQRNIPSLSYFCAVNNLTPDDLEFRKNVGSDNYDVETQEYQWPWMIDVDVVNTHGSIVVNRTDFAKFLIQSLVPVIATQVCFTFAPTIDVPYAGRTNFGCGTIQKGDAGKTPSADITRTGTRIVHIYWDQSFTKDVDTNSTTGHIDIHPYYDCYIDIVGENVISITQDIRVDVSCKSDSTPGNLNNAVNRSRTDQVTLSVDDHGEITTQAPTQTAYSDTSQSGDDYNKFVNFFTHVGDALHSISSTVQTSNVIIGNLNVLPFDSLKSFVFPCAQTFSFSHIRFSKHQDLVCNLTYVKESFPPLAPVLGDSPTSISNSPPPPPTTTTSAPSTGGPSNTSGSTSTGGGTAADGSATKSSGSSSASKVDTTQIVSIASSSTMMQNYVQGAIVDPTDKFEALQTADGHSLLFAVDSAGVFHVIEETSGAQRTGWVLTDLSTSTFEWLGSHGSVIGFDVGQSTVDGTIGLAMMVSLGAKGHLLFLSLGNSSSDTSWIAEPRWTQVNGPGSASGTIFEGVMFCETVEQEQYIIVDVKRSTDDNIQRFYYVSDSSQAGKGTWQNHDIPADILAANYQSCVGRASGEMVDGIYTRGASNDHSQLLYVPVVNVFDTNVNKAPPAPCRLESPGGFPLSAIAAARNPDQTTDLFVISKPTLGDSTLWCFPASQQADGSGPIELLAHPAFSGATELCAMSHNGTTTLWVKNESNVVSYLSCPTGNVIEFKAWSSPVAILDGIEHISPYINRADGGNSLFASGGNKLWKLTQATGNGLWQSQNITLANTPQEPALPFMSYSTTIQVLDANGLGVPSTDVHITSPSRAPVYINGLYYVLSTQAITLKTDASGSINIIETTEDINGTILGVTAGTLEPIAINPMDEAFKKFAALNSSDSLKGASVPAAASLVAGGYHGSYDNLAKDKLVATGVQDTDIQAVADNVGKLQQAYQSLAGTAGSNTQATQAQSAPSISLASASDIGDAIVIAAGDLFQWLKSEGEAVIQILYDEANKVWTFVAKIADQVFSAILDAVEHVVAALVWVFKQIGAAVEKLIAFIQALFAWDNIKRTKNVLYTMVKLSVADLQGQIGALKALIDAQIPAVEKTIDQWAGTTDWSGLGAAAGKPVSSSTANPMQGQNSQSQLFGNQLQNHAGDIVSNTENNSAVGNTAQQLFDQLTTAVTTEGQILQTAYSQLQQLANVAKDLSVDDLLKKLAAILSDTLLSSAQNVLNLALELLIDIIGLVFDLLDEPIQVPVISHILETIGVPSISFLDLMCWVVAVGYTVPYELTHGGTPPFPDNDDTTRLLSITVSGSQSQFRSVAPVVPSAQSAFVVPTAPSSAPIPSGPGAASAADSDVLVSVGGTTYHGIEAALASLTASQRSLIFQSCKSASALVTVWGGGVTVPEAAEETASNGFSKPATAIKAFSALAAGIGDEAVSYDPIDNDVVGIYSKCVQSVTTIAKIAFSGPVFKKFSKKTASDPGGAADDARKYGSDVQSALTLFSIFSTGWHLHELSSKSGGDAKAVAVIGEVGKLYGYLGTYAYCAAVNVSDPIDKAITVAAYAACNTLVGGLQAAQVVTQAGVLG